MTTEPKRSLPEVYWLSRILNEELLGFLALSSLFLGLVPSVFSLSAGSLDLLAGPEWFIIAVFALEYFAAFARASSRLSFVLNPWRILDACIILMGVLALTSAVNNLLRNSPVLRLFRLGRLALVGTRFGTSFVSKAPVDSIDSPGQRPATQVFAVVAGDVCLVEPVTWKNLIGRIHSLQEDWLLVSHVTKAQLNEVAVALDVPETLLRTRFFDSAFPRID